MVVCIVDRYLIVRLFIGCKFIYILFLVVIVGYVVFCLVRGVCYG